MSGFITKHNNVFFRGVAHSNSSRLELIQTWSSSRKRSTTSSISALFCQHAQPNSSTSENLPSSLSDNAISLKQPLALKFRSLLSHI